MSSNRQPEPLRLADLLELDKWPDAAAELRRLYAENQSLQSEAEQNAKILGASAEKELALQARIEELEASLSIIYGLLIQMHGVVLLRKQEALAACISLLKKTPKIMQNIYVGKDSQSWGTQAKTVLKAAIAAQAKYGDIA